MTVRAIAERHLLLDQPLPALPSGADYLLRALSDESMEFADLAGAIEKFPSIAFRVLAVANSVWSSPVSQIARLDQACARLGFKVVRSIAIAVAVASPFDSRLCPGFEAEVYWTSAMLTARAAEMLAGEMNADASHDPGVASTAGILSNLGLLLLATRMPKQANVAFEQARETDRGVLWATREHCGLGYDEAGILLLEAWNLPALLSQMLRQHYESAREEPGCACCAPLGVAAYFESALRHDKEAAPEDVAAACQRADVHSLRVVYETLAKEHDRVRDVAVSLGL